MTVGTISAPPRRATVGRPRSFGLLSTFPPTPCGIATFTAALARGLSGAGREVGVVRIADGSPVRTDAVVGDLVNGSRRSVADCSALLNRHDVAIVQHEYGLYGGPDGEEIVEILSGLRVPAIVIAHTVLVDPTRHQRDVLVSVAALADRLVVMSDAARRRLIENFDVDPRKIATIPHGAAVATSQLSRPRAERPTLLTWGLLGPGKGVERVVDAMADLRDLSPRPRYLVAGSTHPKVLAAEGEAYRTARVAQAERLGVGDSVHFDDAYRDLGSLASLIAAAAVVVLPYDSREQVTSGVLVDAIAAGRPVVATAFPHAIELLSSGAGIVVDHDDPRALVDALRRVLFEPGLAEQMSAEALRLAPGIGWPVVAARYIDLATRLEAPERVSA